jgi:hypothetical protein
MPGNPNIQQGTLNRVKATVTVPLFNGQLDVIPPYLAKAGISLALEGNAADYFPSMTGAVPSPVPYQIATLTINLLKSQPFSQIYKAQFEENTLIGDVTVYPDVGVAAPSGSGTAGTAYGLQAYYLKNCVLETVRDLNFAGEEPQFVVSIKGYYEVNNAMFNQ